ncbi:MAG: MarR family winged helix-turn-helix transcriptional regulator [Ktedonobacteraceae bacterium]
MSSDSQEKHAEILGELDRGLRQFTGLGTSFFRAAAARVGMTVSDVQVLDFLDSAGPMTAGQLADLTGLTTGAITGMINRLEEAGLVNRGRDPNDGRKVIVRLAGDKSAKEIESIFASLEREWNEIASHYNDEQIALLLEFVKNSNAVTRNEIVRLRETPSGTEGIYTAPLGDLSSAQLVFPSGTFRLALHAGDIKGALYQARFEGPVPEVKVKDGIVAIRYPRRLWMPSKSQRSSEVTLNSTIPWQLLIQGGASEITADLAGLNLVSLEVKGDVSMVRLDLPTPVGKVPVNISGGASDVVVRRPAGVGVRAHLKGWASTFIFDDQSFSYVGNDVRLQSQGYAEDAPHYDIEVASSASMVTITTI